ncbi:MAG TPA: FadR family transcriptional regulator [Candidatus Acetothermia bacterium]|nr:FadR family transcriptional regulator [Candidatus Acetothermia bacterium]
MPFGKVTTKRKHLCVAEQILSAIKQGLYKPDDKLPPERVLADEMGVSRNSIREALSALQVLNIIESRAGDGTYVKKMVGNINIESQILPILEESENPFRIFEARNILEMGVVELAIDTATAEALGQLEKVLDNMRECAHAGDYDGYLTTNLNFHLAIASATENPIIESTMSFLWSTTSQQLLNKTLKRYWQEKFASSVEIHEHIFTAIRDKNKELAHQAVRRHYEEPKEYLLGTLTG